MSCDALDGATATGFTGSVLLDDGHEGAAVTTQVAVKQYGIYVDGRWSGGSSAGMTAVINPATETAVGEVVDGTREDAVRAIEAARRAFDEGPWPTMSVEERRTALRAMVEVLDRRRDELVDINVSTGGAIRPLAEAVQVHAAIEHFRDMVDRVMPRFDWEVPSPAHVGAGIGQGVTLREPFGVAALISAYNFPLLLNIVKLAPALAAGCTTVLKPAVTTPVEALVLAEVADEAGLPPGVVNVVTGDKDVSMEMSTGQALVDRQGHGGYRAGRGGRRGERCVASGAGCPGGVERRAGRRRFHGRFRW